MFPTIIVLFCINQFTFLYWSATPCDIGSNSQPSSPTFSQICLRITLCFFLQVVKALVIMLHRQWLTVRRVEGNLVDAHERRVVQLLRDTVLLLHNLSQKDKRFHSHCMDVLHQFDHVMPGVRAILRKNPNLKACEGEGAYMKRLLSF